MFEELQNNQENKVDDIFTESEKGSSAQDPRMINQNPNQNPMMQNPQGASSAFQDFEEEGSRSSKILKTLFVIILILAIIGVAAYFVYSKILLPKTINAPVIENQNNQNNNEDNNFQFEEDLNQVIEEENNTSTDDLIINDDNSEENILKNIDTDEDGLSDFDEINLYNTDPLIADTDGDGLSDFDEIMIFNTDPLNPDTDGDTYLDGQEVLSGYNPLGEGKLDMSLIKDMDLFLEKYPELSIK